MQKLEIAWLKSRGMPEKNLDRKLVKEVTGKAAAEFEHLEVLVALSQGLTEVSSSCNKSRTNYAKTQLETHTTLV